MRKLNSLMEVLFLLFLCGCNGNHFEIEGQRLNFNIHKDSLELRQLGCISKIGLPKIDNIQFYSPLWSKDENTIFMSFNETTYDKNCQNHGICTYDLKQKSINILYKDSCNIVDFMPSPNEKFILIRRFSYRDWLNEQYTGSKKINHDIEYLIYNPVTKTTKSSITIKSSLYLKSFIESNWSLDSKRVLISCKSKESIERRNEDWFIYDISTNDTTFVGTGCNFIWSSKDQNLIAYLKDNAVWFYHPELDRHKLFYQFPSRKTIKSFRWTPDGSELLILYGQHNTFLKPFGDKISWFPYSMLINMDDKKIMTKDGHEFIDTWKN